MLTKRQRSFQNSRVIDTGLSDFHKMTVTVLRSAMCRGELSAVIARLLSKCL